MSCANRIIFPQALDSYRLMAKHLSKAVESIYRPGVGYKKSGVVLPNLISREDQIVDLFDSINIIDDCLLPSLESIKKRFGKSSIYLASAKLSDKWSMKCDRMSRCFTTDIEQILEVN